MTAPDVFVALPPFRLPLMLFLICLLPRPVAAAATPINRYRYVVQHERDNRQDFRQTWFTAPGAIISMHMAASIEG